MRHTQLQAETHLLEMELWMQQREAQRKLLQLAESEPELDYAPDPFARFVEAERQLSRLIAIWFAFATLLVLALDLLAGLESLSYAGSFALIYLVVAGTYFARSLRPRWVARDLRTTLRSPGILWFNMIMGVLAVGWSTLAAFNTLDILLSLNLLFFGANVLIAVAVSWWQRGRARQIRRKRKRS